jgi:hypothetical protein
MILKSFLPTPHPSKAVFNSHKFPISAVAKYLGLSYNFTCNILSGTTRVTDENELRIKELVEMLEKEGLENG